MEPPPCRRHPSSGRVPRCVRSHGACSRPVAAPGSQSRNPAFTPIHPANAKATGHQGATYAHPATYPTASRPGQDPTARWNHRAGSDRTGGTDAGACRESQKHDNRTEHGPATTDRDDRCNDAFCRLFPRPGHARSALHLHRARSRRGSRPRGPIPRPGHPQASAHPPNTARPRRSSSQSLSWTHHSVVQRAGTRPVAAATPECGGLRTGHRVASDGAERHRFGGSRHSVSRWRTGSVSWRSMSASARA
jgi:hypothetical protein